MTIWEEENQWKNKSSHRKSLPNLLYPRNLFTQIVSPSNLQWKGRQDIFTFLDLKNTAKQNSGELTFGKNSSFLLLLPVFQDLICRLQNKHDISESSTYKPKLWERKSNFPSISSWLRHPSNERLIWEKRLNDMCTSYIHGRQPEKLSNSLEWPKLTP